MPAMTTKSLISPDYVAFVNDLKARIQSARVSAARAVNRDLILLYWDIGRGIVEKQAQFGWGESVVEMLAQDLQAAFPEMRGFAARSLWNMRRFFMAYAAPEILPQAVAELQISRSPKKLQQDGAKRGRSSSRSSQLEFLQQLVEEIPWGHHLLLLDKVKELAARLYYLQATARFGWTRNVLLNQIKAQAYERAKAEKKTHNFAAALPEHLAEQAEEALKSRYNLEFLGIGRAVRERELEGRLVERLRDFILELGYGFCFVGRQYRLALGKKILWTSC